MSVLSRITPERYAARDRSVIGIPASKWLGQTNDTIIARSLICDNIRSNATFTGNLTSNAAAAFGSVDISGALLAASFKTSVNSDYPITTPIVVNAGIVDEHLECRLLQTGIRFPTVSLTATAIPAQCTIKFQYTPQYNIRNAQILATTDGAAGVSITHAPVGPASPMVAELIVSFFPFAPAAQLVATWSPQQGTEYDIEISWDRATSNAYLFVDGRMLAQRSFAIPVSADVLNPYIGQPFGITDQNPFLMRNLVILPRVLHTTNFDLVPYAVITANSAGIMNTMGLTCTDLMLCNAAPAYPTSVLRMQDLTTSLPGSMTMTAVGFWNPTGDAMTQTIYLQRYGNMIMAVAPAASATGTMTVASGLTFSVQLPAGWIRPNALNSMKVIVPFVWNGASVNRLLSIEYNPVALAGELGITNSDQLNVFAAFGLGDTVIVSSWSAIWMAT